MKAIIVWLFLLISSVTFCQVDLIKSQVDQLFFYLPIQSQLYEVRKALQKDSNISGVSEYQDYCDCISADFYSNTLLRFIGAEKRVIIWFNENTKVSNSRKLSFAYYPDDLENAEKQLKQLHDIFNRISYHTAPFNQQNVREELSGEGYGFISSEEMYNAGRIYLSINFRYIQASNYGGKSYYHFEIILQENNIH